jgi:16S rRNA (adenine1518-N6/adenine1519-N6)-dimethyltransferase
VHIKETEGTVEVKKLLRRAGLKATGRLGQHFLADEKFLDIILSAAEITSKDTIIEIGPGLGVLTVELAKKAGQVVAVEVDDGLVSFLKKEFSSYNNITIIHEDILKTSLSQLINERTEYKVVANLPYYITSPILHYFVKAVPKPSLMVVMIQKEVAEAIAGSPGKMTAFAASLRIYSTPSIISYVPAHSFYPPPKVDSAIVRFEFFRKPVIGVPDIDGFIDFVRYGFSCPRKQIRNSLARGLNIDVHSIDILLDKTEIEPRRRPETLSLQEWERLYITANTFITRQDAND